MLILLFNCREKAVLAVTLCNEKDEILGHAAFFDYPNSANVDQAEWQEWMNEYYNTRKCTPLNSLFLHYFVAKPEYANGCAREIVRTAFNAVPDVHFLFLCVPIGSFPGKLTLLHSKRPKLCRVLAILNAIWLKNFKGRNRAPDKVEF